MKRLTIVDSTMVHALGYDRATRTMEVVFHTGHIYRYEDVPYRVYLGLLHAESKGEFMKSEVIGMYTESRLSTGRRRKL
jgi:hypothetical protein